MAFRHLRAELICSICLTTYKDPVTLQCGHNFCLSCIEGLLSTEMVDVHTCPECRQRLGEHPTLRRNITLCNIAECFHSSPPGQEDNGIFCTYCIQYPVPAVKCCIHCDASLCVDHLKVHSKSEEHFFDEPKTFLEQRECCIHKKTLRYYCSDDEACLCVLCRLDEEHVGHHIEPINVAYKKKKEELTRMQNKLTSGKKETERRLKSLHQHQTDAQKKSSDLEKRTRTLFNEIRKQLRRLETQILSELCHYKTKMLLSISKHIEELEIRKETLSGKMDDIEMLSNITDPIVFLKEWNMNSATFHDEDAKLHSNVHDAGESHEGLISETLHIGLRDIFNGLKKMIYVSSDISLDVNTACNDLEVSGDLKQVFRSTVSQNRPETPERFQCFQVTSCNVFSSGRHFWDIETSDSGFWMVGVCYPSIDRKEYQPCIGNNKKSWSLCSYNRQYSVRHDTIITHLQPVTSARLRIFLHYDAGQLSFYELCDQFKHLYTFNVTFTEPLHAAFWVWDGWLRIRNKNEFCISPCD